MEEFGSALRSPVYQASNAGEVGIVANASSDLDRELLTTTVARMAKVGARGSAAEGSFVQLARKDEELALVL